MRAGTYPSIHLPYRRVDVAGRVEQHCDQQGSIRTSAIDGHSLSLGKLPRSERSKRFFAVAIASTLQAFLREDFENQMYIFIFDHS